VVFKRGLRSRRLSRVLGTGTPLLAYFATAWAINAYFQSYSALALIKVNSGWFHVRERGVFSAISDR